MPTGPTPSSGRCQVNSTIINTDAICSEFSLLNQQGSTVVQGSMQLIPVDDSLALRPADLRACREAASSPRSAFVIVFYDGTAVLGTTLDDALVAVPGVQRPRAAAARTPTTPTHADRRRRRAARDRPVAQLLDQAQHGLRRGPGRAQGQATSPSYQASSINQLGDDARPGRRRTQGAGPTARRPTLDVARPPRPPRRTTSTTRGGPPRRSAAAERPLGEPERPVSGGIVRGRRGLLLSP